jgi:hypothetical protein
MSDAPQGRRVPAWAFAATFVGVALVAGLLGWLAGNARPAPVVVVAETTPTSTVETSPTVTLETSTTVPTTVTVEATKTLTVTTVTNACRVTEVTWSASGPFRITLDYVQVVYGKAAAKAATAAGKPSPPPYGYFIVNSSSKLRTFSVPKTLKVNLQGTKVSMQYFSAIMPGAAKPQDDYALAYYWVTVQNGKTVSKIEQIPLPGGPDGWRGDGSSQ